MQNYAVKTIKKPVDVITEVPGSKSITNRALLMAAMAEGESVLQGVLFSADSKVFLSALQELGFDVSVDEKQKSVRIMGQGGEIPKSNGKVYVGSAGTAARFLTAFLAVSDGVYELESSEQMKKRPMKDLLVALETLGAKITYYEKEYTFPMKIEGVQRKNWSKENNVELNIDLSSQFLSALLMVAPLCFEELTIQLTGKRNARAYVEMTEQMMKQFKHPGVIKKNKDCYQVKKGKYISQNYMIEPDVSAACYFYAMAAVTGGKAMVCHMKQDSLQGDMRFIEVLQKMGCTISWTYVDGMQEKQLMLCGPKEGRLKAITQDFSDFSDQALTMAAIAPYADGEITIEGIAHIRGQESDRATVICTELEKMGIHCEQTTDTIHIYPGNTHGAVIETYDDHRVAMSFAICGLRTEGIEIKNPECCSKTFPEYFEKLDEVLL